MALVTKNFSDIITFTRASTATFFNSAGVLTSAATDSPRFDYNPSTLAAQGLLIEESRTNSIRNNTMVGAAAGTPGTLPTNWSVSGGTGLIREIVGTGTFNGVTYIDIKLSGNSSASFIDLYFEPSNGIAAVNGQIWSAAYWVQVVAGSLTNVSSVNLSALQFDSGLVALGSTTNGTASASVGSTWQRINRTHTTNNAATAYIRPYIALGLSIGVAIDITLRIGLPQLELGAFATSVIPTTTTALTRAADVASVNTLSPWFNASAGTLYTEATRTGGQPYIVMLSNGVTASERYYLRYVSSQYQFIPRAGGVDGTGVFVSAGGTLTSAKNAAAYTNVQNRIATNGLQDANSTAAVATQPSGLTTMYLGSFTGTGSFLNGWLQRVTYYPRSLTNAELVSITA